jgi:hypothetical protein
MLIALFAYFLSGMLEFNVMFATASKYIKGMDNSVRKERLMKDVNDAQQVYAEYQNTYVSTMEALYKMDDKKWTKEYVNETLATLNQKRRQSEHKLLDLRFKIKAELSKDEWEAAIK